MSTTVATLVRKVESRVRDDAEFARLLDALIAAPTAPRGTLERAAAGELNEHRHTALVRGFVDGTLPTPAVQRLLGLGSPQAVHRLRTRGKLLGTAVGNQTWFPAWQFDTDRLRLDLPRILQLLTRFTADPVAADRVMRITHSELGGHSIAEALRRPETADDAWRMLTAVGA